MRKRFIVRPAPGMSEEAGLTYFAVKGPGVNEFVTMDRIAKLLEAALNAADEYNHPRA